MDNILKSGDLVGYGRTRLKNFIDIGSLITIYYFEFAKDYIFLGEKHDFWEFVYVDKGEVEVMADDRGYKLNQGEMIFHKPNEFHNLWANGRIAPNIVVISFESESPSLKYFENRIVSLDSQERNMLAQIMRESKDAFDGCCTYAGSTRLKRKSNPQLGCEQLIKLYIEQLLINIIRRNNSIVPETRLSTSIKERYDGDIIEKVVAYMRQNPGSALSFDDICKYSGIGRSSLKTIFKEATGMSVIEYYNIIKIDEAKRLMREENLNFTAISERLGYSSIHYFSRHFKKATGMSPTEYTRSLKAYI